MGSQRRMVVTVAAMALLTGLAVGRFAMAEPTAFAPTVTTAHTVAAQVAALERAVEAQPTDLASWQALGTAYTQRAFEVGDPSFYGLATRAFDRAERLGGDQAGTLLGRGHLALALHAFADAHAYAERALLQRPHSAEVLGVLVDADVELGHYGSAAARLQEMLDLRPGLPALARTSYLRELHGDLEGATEAMRRAEAAGSGSSFEAATVAALLGDLHLAQGDLEAATTAYERALDAAPTLVGAGVGLARVDAARGDSGAAISRLKAVVDRFPQPDAVILLGDLHAEAGEGELARQQYALARTIARLQEGAGQNVDLELALFEADRGDDPARALELAQRAYEARPANVYAADTLAWALLRSGRAEEATVPMEDALRLGTADALMRFHAAEVFAAAGDPERAREELAAALETNPWFSVAHRGRAATLTADLGVPQPVAWEEVE
ncbi:MAG TPA: tetratricopeptide repeat protein [Egibacteraceae bacterium]|jgi:tetratricopeptide (TPR) repeat protein|nr:tetratricopeptide repeat protein [Egibacteraceae bacterium]